MAKGIPLFPYPVSTAMETTLSEFDDPSGQETVSLRKLVNEEELSADSSVASYDVSSLHWKALTFRVSVKLPDGELERILPATSDPKRDTAMTVAVMCPTTKYRHGFLLKAGRNGTWTGHVSLKTEDVKSKVFLRATLSRTTEIPASSQLPYAQKLGAVIGFGQRVAIFLSPRTKGFQGSIPITWEDFSNSENEWRRAHADDVYHLEPYADASLFLNSRYTQLREILESSAKRGQEATLRDLAGVMIAQPVLIQLALTALGAIELDDETDDEIGPSGWRAEVLQSVLPRVYPDIPDPQHRLKRAAQDIREAGGMASLVSRLGSAVQESVGNYKVMEGAIRSYEGTRLREELDHG